MAKRKQTVQVADVSEPKADTLTWEQERFVEEYIENGGNATEAYHVVYGGKRTCAAELGSRLLKKVEIIGAVEAERNRIRGELRVTRDRGMRLLAAIAFTSADEVADILKTPYQKESYRGLGMKRKAVHVQNTPDGPITSTPTASERRAALNDLREMLGLDKEQNSGNWLDGLGELFGAIDRVKERRGK